MGLDCGSIGSSLHDHLFWLNNKVWRGISAWQEGYKRTSAIEICQKKDSGEVFNFKKNDHFLELVPEEG